MCRDSDTDVAVGEGEPEMVLVLMRRWVADDGEGMGLEVGPRQLGVGVSSDEPETFLLRG